MSAELPEEKRNAWTSSPSKPELAESLIGDGDYWDDEMTEDEWRTFIAYTLFDELNDSRQDIYTMEDGFPYPHSTNSENQ